MWQPAFESGDEVEARALPLMGVHMGHIICCHRGAVVCVNCGGYSMWVYRKLRRDCLGNPSQREWGTAKTLGQANSGHSFVNMRRCQVW